METIYSNYTQNIEKMRAKLRQVLPPDIITKIRAIKNDDITWYSVPDNVKKYIGYMERIDPDLFKEPKSFTAKDGSIGFGVKTDNTAEANKKRLANKAYQSELLNVTPKGTAAKAMEQTTLQISTQAL